MPRKGISQSRYEAHFGISQRLMTGNLCDEQFVEQTIISQFIPDNILEKNAAKYN